MEIVLGPRGSPITDAVADRQDGQKVIVWSNELAPGKPRFPTPPWSQRP